jgi:RasGEF N-terminal motif
MVISGTLKALFDGLIIPIEQDMSYVEVFLACYKFFTTPQVLFQTLEEWYYVTEEGSLLPGAESMLKNTKRQIQSRSIRVILLWIRNHWQDFQLNPKLMSDLENFTHGMSKVSFGDNQKLIHAIREQKLSWFTSQYVPMFSGIKLQDSGKLWNIEMDTEAFAQNLTAIDNLFFRQMRPDYYLRLLATEQQMTGGAYNIALNTILTYCGWFRMVLIFFNSRWSGMFQVLL